LSLKLREEHRLRVFENRVLRRICVPKSDKVAGGWRKEHNEDLYNLYSSLSIIRMMKSKGMRWAGHVLGKPEGERPLGKPRRKLTGIIKMDHREMGWGGVDWIDLAQDRDQWKALLNTAMNLPLPGTAGKFSNSCITGGLSRRAELPEDSGLVKGVMTLLQCQTAAVIVSFPPPPHTEHLWSILLAT
jgi:hypothetical protein